MDVQTEEDRKGMEAALERARETPPDEWDSKLEKLSKLWESPEEVPTKETGDEKPAEGHSRDFAEGLDLTDPNAVELRKPGAGPLDVISGGEPKADAPPPPERPTEPWAALKHDLEQGAKARPSTDALESKMQAAGWAPRPSSAPPDWEALQKNLQDAQGRAEAQRTIQQSFHAVAPRFEADRNAGAEDIAAAKAPLEMAQEKQRFEAQQTASEGAQLAQHEKLLAEAKERDRNDKTSQESKDAREQTRGFWERAGGVPQGFENMTAAEIDNRIKTYAPIAAQLTQEHIAKVHEDAAAKAKADADKAKADAAATKAGEEKTAVDALREVARKSPRLGELGLKPEDLDKMDRKAIEELDKNLRDLPNKKPGTGGGPAKAVTSLDDIKDPADRAMVQKVLSNEWGLEDLPRKSKDRIAGLVAQLGEGHNTAAHATFKKVNEELAADPKIQAAVNAKQHFARAIENMPDNFDSNMFNRISNAVQHGSGGAGLSKYESDIAVGAGEMAKGLQENDMAGKEALKALLEPGQSKEQMRQHLKELVFLQDENLETRRRQFEAVAPKGTPLPALLQREQAKGEGPPAPGTVTVLDTKTRRSANKTPEQAKAIMAADKEKRFQVVGEPHI